MQSQHITAFDYQPIRHYRFCKSIAKMTPKNYSQFSNAQLFNPQSYSPNHRIYSTTATIQKNNYAPTMKIPIAIRSDNKTITVDAMIDSGATSCFIHPRVIENY